MEPFAMVSLTMTLVEKFIKLLLFLRKKKGKKGKKGNPEPESDELILDCLRQFDKQSACFRYLKSANFLGYNSRSLDELLDELLKSIDYAKVLLNPPLSELSSEHIERVQKILMDKFRKIREDPELQSKVEVNIAIKDIVVRDPEAQKIFMHVLSLDQKLSYSTETFHQKFYNTDDELLMLQAPEAKTDGGARRQMKAITGMDALTERRTREGALDKGKEVDTSTELIDYGLLCNPNRKQSLVAEEGRGEVDVFKCEGNGWRVIYQGSSKAVRKVIGEKRMQPSGKLGCFYYEVKLEEIEELGYSSQPGVGIGLAKELRNGIVGIYPRSYGYDSRFDAAYAEGSVAYHNGKLRVGDTLGIGLITEQVKSPFVFFTKNGVLQNCMSRSSLARSSGLLYPIITLAAPYVQVLINFHGPFRLPPISDLLAEAPS